ESDERFTSAAVMPLQLAHGYAGCLRLIQDAFQILLVFGNPLSVIFGAPEEIGRRQLLRIPHDDGLTRPCYRTDSITRRNLGCLVEDDDIEPRMIDGQELSDREWRHEHARRELREALRHARDHFTDGLARPLQLHLMAEQTQLGVARYPLDWRQIVGNRADHAPHRMRAHQIIEFLEFLDGVLVFKSPEVSQ